MVTLEKINRIMWKIAAAVIAWNASANALDCNPNACSITSQLPLGITSGGYMAIGPNTESPILAYSNGRNVAAIRPNGKLELAGDPNAVLGTADISVMGTAERMKIGGGFDTNTESGARLMIHGNTASISPGQLVLQAGRTPHLDQEGKGAVAWLGTTVAQPVIIAVEDVPFVRFEADRTVNFLQPVIKRRNGKPALEIKVDGQTYLVPLIRVE